MAHGGKRDNAGRKAQRGPHKIISASLPLDALSIIEARYGNTSEFIRMAVIEKLSKEVDSLPAHLMGELCRPLPAPQPARRATTAPALLTCQPATITEHILASLLGGLRIRRADYIRETGFGRATGYRSTHGATELQQARWMLHTTAPDLDTISQQLAETWAQDHGGDICSEDVRLDLIEVLRSYQTRAQITAALTDAYSVAGTLYATIEDRSLAAMHHAHTQAAAPARPYTVDLPADVRYMVQALEADPDQITAAQMDAAMATAAEQIANMSPEEIDALNAEYDSYFAALTDTQRSFLTSQYETTAIQTGESPEGTARQIVSSHDGQTIARYLTTAAGEHTQGPQATTQRQLKLIA